MVAKASGLPPVSRVATLNQERDQERVAHLNALSALRDTIDESFFHVAVCISLTAILPVMCWAVFESVEKSDGGVLLSRAPPLFA